MWPGGVAGQPTGTIVGRVLGADDGAPLYGAEVELLGTSRKAFTDRDGAFALERVTAGVHTLVVRRIDRDARKVEVRLAPGDSARVEVALEPRALRVGEIEVTGAALRPQRTVEAPAAVAVLPRERARDFSLTAQAPRALVGLPGVQVVQSGMYDFNVAARGFNTTLNRRVLVLQDGRDLSVAFLGSQEWATLSVPLDEMERVEMIRGPGSALYGANAFSGVLSFTTPSAREAVGTKASVSAGELATVDADVRHAGVFGGGRFGYRLTGGFYRSESWSRSRTRLGSLEDEYRGSVDLDEHPVEAPEPGYETLPLLGQEKGAPPGQPGPALGEPDPVTSAYGTGRFDWYADDGSILTLEGGVGRAENHVNVTPIGRIQVTSATRPWARVEWASEGLELSAWYSGRVSDDQRGLASGFRISESSAIYQAEARYGGEFQNARGRFVAGGSLRAAAVDSDTTFVAEGDESRLDASYALYGQVEYDLRPRFRVVLASRLDHGALFGPQLSPRVALVYTPSPGSSLRLSVNRAFKTPNILEYFLAVPAGPDQDLSRVEDALRASPLGPSLEDVPDGRLFGDSDRVPVFAFGNRDLGVEQVTGFELGYKGLVGPRLYLTADLFYNRLRDFVTDLLPGANPRYGPWTAPAAVADSARPQLESVLRGLLGSRGLTRLSDGRTAFVLSIGNAGPAEAWGLELSAGLTLSSGLRIDASYTYSGFDVDASSLAAGGRPLPNTPEHAGAVSASYGSRDGLSARVQLNAASGYDWMSGIFSGWVPARWTVDLAGGYRLGDALRLSLLATNLLDRKHYEVFGGSVIGRRLLAGLSLSY